MYHDEIAIKKSRKAVKEGRYIFVTRLDDDKKMMTIINPFKTYGTKENFLNVVSKNNKLPLDTMNTYFEPSKSTVTCPTPDMITTLWHGVSKQRNSDKVVLLWDYERIIAVGVWDPKIKHQA